MNEPDPVPAPENAAPPPPQPPAPEATPPPPPPESPAVQVPAAPPPPPAAPVVSDEIKNKKLMAGLFGILLGGLGVHKFYLGYQQEGIIMLLVTVVGGGVGTLFCIGIPLIIVMPIIGLIEGILYLSKTDREFADTYVIGRKPWF